MALSVTHPHVSAIADGADATLVRPSNWNAAHTLTGIASADQGGTGIAFFTAAGPTIARTYTFPDADSTILVSGGALGTPASGTATNITGLPEAGLTLADNTTNNAATTKHGFLPKLDNVATNFLNGQGAWAAPTASATLNGISAATADQAGISNADWNVRWNWAKVTDSEVAFELGESAASTNGTSTSGVPNQIIAKFSTVAASTASPLSVYSRAAHVFSVSPTAAKILATTGNVYSFAAGTASGIGIGPSNQGLTFYGPQGANGFYFDDGTDIQMRIYGTGNFVRPTFTDSSNATSGIVAIGNPATVGIAVSSIENSRFNGAQGAAVFQASNAGAVTTGYALNFRKSRGTVASPTVITTGDDMATITGAAYVGATGTYVSAAQILFDSIGTVADTTSGIGGKIDFNTAIVGVVGLTTKMSVWNDGDVTIGIASPATTITVGFPQIPTMAGTPTGVPTVKTGFNPMVYDSTNRKLYIYDYGGTPAWVGVQLA